MGHFWHMAVAIARPKLEGNVAVGDDRQIGFAEFGDPQGRAIFWLHGTPGARRQIPVEARVYAETEQIRLIGVDRPGIGSSTPAPVRQRLDFADDLRTIADTLGIDKMAVVGLSGGGPYTLGCAAAMPDRVVAAGVLGGVAPTRGSDANRRRADGQRRPRVAPLLEHGRDARSSLVATALIRLIKPGRRARADLYAGSPRRPTAAAGPARDSRRCSSTTCSTAAANSWRRRSPTSSCSPGTGVSGSTRSRCPVRWWHGDADHIVPFSHGSMSCRRLPDAELYPLPGESHLAGLGQAEEILHDDDRGVGRLRQAMTTTDAAGLRPGR